MKPVCNATPLIHLSRIGRLGLLRELYTQVLVPNAVADEVARRSTVELDAGLASDWLKRVTPRDRERVDQIARDLGGRGEAEVIGVWSCPGFVDTWVKLPAVVACAAGRRPGD